MLDLYPTVSECIIVVAKVILAEGYSVLALESDHHRGSTTC